MFKYIAIPFFLAAVNAGYLSAPALAPVSYSAPIVTAPVAIKTALPVATSYQNTYKVSAPIAYAAAPVVKAAPLLAAPVAYSHPVAPIVSYAGAPILKSGPLVASPLSLGHYGLH